MITREADYAIRAVLYLSTEGKEGPVSSLELSKKMGIPYRFMRRIGLKLQKCGFIDSRKGKGGGIKLAKKPEQITILDLLKAFDGDGFKLNECLADGKSCVRSEKCPIHTQMGKLQDMIETQLAALSLDKLV